MMIGFFRPVVVAGIMSGLVFGLILMASYVYGIVGGSMFIAGIALSVSAILLFVPLMEICDELEWFARKEEESYGHIS
jgi:tetrahydromethanopterin S-methyltransferase subunit E